MDTLLESIKNLNDVDMIKIDDNIMNDTGKYGIKVVDKNIILKELNFENEEEYYFMDDLITNYEKNVAKHVANYQTCTLCSMGTLKLNPIKQEDRKHREMFDKLFVEKGVDSYKKFKVKLNRQTYEQEYEKRHKEMMHTGNYHPEVLGEGLLKLVDKDNNLARINISNYMKVMTKTGKIKLKIPKRYVL